jgi:translation initiation factor IF-2
MSKIRVFQLAAELEFDKNKLVSLCKDHGLNVRSPLSSVDDPMESEIRSLVEKLQEKSDKTDGVIRSMRDLPSISSDDLESGKVRISQEKEQAQETAPTPEAPVVTGPQPPTGTEAPKPLDPLNRLPRKKVAMTEFERQQAKIQKRKKQKEKQHQRQEKLEQRERVEEEEAQTLRLNEAVSPGELAHMMGENPSDLISKLFSMGIMAAINQKLDVETCSILAGEFGYQVIEEKVDDEVFDLDMEDPEETLKPRDPVVTIMGHVDHGKTTLLDAIRRSKIVDTEAGGITQHIGAYRVDTKSGGSVCFLDTPGHEAFTAMRAHGSQITDIAVLVVAADDGCKPQTIEAINHAKNADVPIIVAITKCDKTGVALEKVYEELGTNGLIVEAWGGNVPSQPVSGITGEGIDDLLELIHLQAQLMELKANPDRAAVGVIVEAGMQKGRGAVATVLVQKGQLKIGDPMVAGSAMGRVRSMTDESGKPLEFAGPSTPVEITGFSEIPQHADRFHIVPSERNARFFAEQREERIKDQKARGGDRVVNLESLFAKVEKGKLKELKLVVKADVHGSLIAIAESLEKIQKEDVRVRVIHSGVGAVSEGDIMLASAAEAIIICFHVRADGKTMRLAEDEKVEIRSYKIIYQAIEEIEKAITGMLTPKYKEVVLGRATIREVFSISKVGKIAGSFVESGKIIRGKQARLIRDGVEVFDGKVDNLNRFQETVSEVLSGYECGINLAYNDVKISDVVEVYEMEEIPRDA